MATRQHPYLHLYPLLYTRPQPLYLRLYPLRYTHYPAPNGRQPPAQEHETAVIARGRGPLSYCRQRRHRQSPAPGCATATSQPPTQGYETFGITRDGDALVYREWAPAARAAALIGDFNDWQPAWMSKDEWGVWSVRLPDGGYLRERAWGARGARRAGGRAGGGHAGAGGA